MTTSATSPLEVTSGRGESQGALGDAWKIHGGCIGEQRAGFDGELILQHASNHCKKDTSKRQFLLSDLMQNICFFVEACASATTILECH
jgi:hypothetical protein